MLNNIKISIVYMVDFQYFCRTNQKKKYVMETTEKRGLHPAIEQRRRLYSNFVTLLEAYGAADYYATHSRINPMKNTPETWVISAMSWAETPQGVEYWDSIYQAWKTILIHYKNED